MSADGGLDTDFEPRAMPNNAAADGFRPVPRGCVRISSQRGIVTTRVSQGLFRLVLLDSGLAHTNSFS